MRDASRSRAADSILQEALLCGPTMSAWSLRRMADGESALLCSDGEIRVFFFLEGLQFCDELLLF